ncbi:MAG: hypothetical protein VB111_03135 [Clostridiaceae bacterium]|nr:hypothetical protein [Clostridiaceae bacterium]
MNKVILDNLSKLNIGRSELVSIGFSPQKFDDVRRGKSSFNLADVLLISEKFQLPIDYLLGRTTDRGPSIKENPASGDESPRSGVDERVMSLLDQMTEDQKRQWIDLLESFLREKGIDPNTHRE